MLFIGLLIFCYNAYRAVHVSITFDEVWTFDLASQPIADIMFAENNFLSANNHILNSLLIKPCIQLFGHHVWVLRLPNILAYLLYMIGSILLARKLFSRPIIQFSLFILLNTNLYLFDFFCLSRGYGLSNSFELMSILFLLSAFKTPKQTWIGASFLFAALAVYANFTWINFYLPLWCMMNVVFFLKDHSHTQHKLKTMLMYNAWPFFFASLLTLISYRPISILRKQDEFKWGANAWIDSMHTFAKDITYVNQYYITVAVQIILFAFFLLVIIVIIQQFKQKILFEKFELLFFSAGLILSTISLTILQRFILDTRYMDGRKATMFIVPLIILVISLLDFFYVNYTRWVKVALLSLFSLITFQCVALHKTSLIQEWWFDEDTQDVAAYAYKHPRYGNSSFVIDWHFVSSMYYYSRFNYNHQLEPLTTLDFVNDTIRPAYYYVMSETVPLIPAEFQPLVKLDQDRYVFIKDSLAYQKQLNDFFNSHDSSQMSNPFLLANEAIRKARPSLDKLQFRLQKSVLKKD